MQDRRDLGGGGHWEGWVGGLRGLHGTGQLIIRRVLNRRQAGADTSPGVPPASHARGQYGDDEHEIFTSLVISLLPVVSSPPLV